MQGWIYRGQLAPFPRSPPQILMQPNASSSRSVLLCSTFPAWKSAFTILCFSFLLDQVYYTAQAELTRSWLSMTSYRPNSWRKKKVNKLITQNVILLFNLASSGSSTYSRPWDSENRRGHFISLTLRELWNTTSLVLIIKHVPWRQLPGLRVSSTHTKGKTSSSRTSSLLQRSKYNVNSLKGEKQTVTGKMTTQTWESWVHSASKQLCSHF